MSTTACARCDKQVATDQLIPHGGKRICLECELELDENQALRRSVYRSMASLPAAVLLGWATLCIPFANFVLFPVAAIGVIVLAVQGVRLGLSIQQAPEEYGVGPNAPIILIVLGVLTGVAGLGMSGLALLMLAGLAINMMG